MALNHLLILLSVLSFCWCVKNVHLDLPSYVKTGGNISIICNYALEDERLYSLKLYLDDKEFLRYIPKDKVPITINNIPGDDEAVYDCHPDCVSISFFTIDMRANGLYKCEVTADAPQFYMAFTEKRLTVAEVPEGEPSLHTNKVSYRMGEHVKATCSSRGGYPPATITWFVNNNQQIVNSSWSWVTHFVENKKSNVSVSEMQLVAAPFLTVNDSLLVRCVATIFNLYSSSSDLLVHVDATTNGASSVVNMASAAWCTSLLLALFFT